MRSTTDPQFDSAPQPAKSRSFLPGFIFCFAGLLSALYGLGRLTSVEKVSGDPALETEVNIAIAHGGVRFVVEHEPELEAERERAHRRGLAESSPLETIWPSRIAKGKLRIDLSSKEPCPT